MINHVPCVVVFQQFQMHRIHYSQGLTTVLGSDDSKISPVVSSMLDLSRGFSFGQFKLKQPLPLIRARSYTYLHMY